MPLNGGNDLVRRLGPDEGFGVVVVLVDELSDRALELARAPMNTSLERSVGQEREPAFDLVQPRAVGRNEVEVKPLVPLEPPLDLRS